MRHCRTNSRPYRTRPRRKRGAKAARAAEVARAETEQIRKQREEELNQLHQALDHIVATRRTADGLIMSLPESALRFDFDRATIRPEGRELLSRCRRFARFPQLWPCRIWAH